jgi:hypothetical protein
MRKLAVAALVTVLGCAGCGLLPTLHLGAGVSAVVPEETDTLENTYMLDVFLKVEVSMLQLEGSIGYKQYAYTEAAGREEETLNEIPVAATARFVIGGPSLVRILLGGGLVWNVHDASEIGSLDVENALCYRALVGVDLKLISSFKLGLEVSYDLSNPTGASEFDSDGAMYRLTLGYHF